jgi:hypothetical protein
MSDDQADAEFGTAVGAATPATTVEGVAVKEEKAAAAAAAASVKPAITPEKKDEGEKKPIPSEVKPEKTSKELAADEVKRLQDEQTRLANEAESKRLAAEAAARSKTPQAIAPVDLTATRSILTEVFKDDKFGADGIAGLEGFEKEYGSEITNAMMKMVDVMARRYSTEAVAPIAQAEQARQAEAATNALMSTMETEYGHTDIREIRTNDKFWAFVDGLDKPIRDAVEGGNPKILNFVVNAYKEEAGLPTSKSGGKDKTAIEAEQRAKRKETDDLHRNTSRSRERAPAVSGPEIETDDDAERAFNDASKPTT